MRRMRHPRLGLKFGLALFALVTGALGIVYLAVVPRLESRLVDAKINELKSARASVATQFERSNPISDYDDLAGFFQSSLGARVVVLERLHGNRLSDIADSNPLNPGNIGADPVAHAALDSGATASGR